MPILRFPFSGSKPCSLQKRALVTSFVVFQAIGFVSANGVYAQRDATYQAPAPATSNRPFDSRDTDFPRNPDLERKLQRSRETERQKRIVDDARRLVELSAEYRTRIEAHGSPGVDGEKLLLQMEKLARDIRDRMRGM